MHERELEHKRADTHSHIHLHVPCDIYICSTQTYTRNIHEHEPLQELLHEYNISPKSRVISIKPFC
jgi:hypothetical protein